MKTKGENLGMRKTTIIEVKDTIILDMIEWQRRIYVNNTN